jgi:hypothetical protein
MTISGSKWTLRAYTSPDKIFKHQSIPRSSKGKAQATPSNARNTPEAAHD